MYKDNSVLVCFWIQSLQEAPIRKKIKSPKFRMSKNKAEFDAGFESIGTVAKSVLEENQNRTVLKDEKPANSFSFYADNFFVGTGLQHFRRIQKNQQQILCSLISKLIFL
jgi:hypothetical protein